MPSDTRFVAGTPALHIPTQKYVLVVEVAHDAQMRLVQENKFSHVYWVTASSLRNLSKDERGVLKHFWGRPLSRS